MNFFRQSLTRKPYFSVFPSFFVLTDFVQFSYFPKNHLKFDYLRSLFPVYLNMLFHNMFPIFPLIWGFFSYDIMIDKLYDIIYDIITDTSVLFILIFI